MSLNLAIPLREAVLSNDAVTSQLSQWNGEPAVFTRRPVPSEGLYPMVLISPDISIGNMDSIKTRIPMPRRDLTIVGLQPDDYRLVEDIAYLWRIQFHRQRFSVSVPGFSVIDIVVTGPIPAPVDDAKEVARAVLLQLRLQDLST